MVKPNDAVGRRHCRSLALFSDPAEVPDQLLGHRTEILIDKLIPASGYYEWKNEAGGKQPYYFSRSDGYPLTFAGLWDEWKDRAADETLKSCTMIVTDPNDLAAEIHDRACRSFWSAPTSSHGCMMAGRGCSRLQMRFFSAGQFPSASIARKPIPTTKL